MMEDLKALLLSLTRRARRDARSALVLHQNTTSMTLSHRDGWQGALACHPLQRL